MKGTGVFLLTTLAVLASGLAAAQVEEEIRERIRPVGEICVQGEPCAQGLQTSGGGTSGSGARDPQTVYQTYCMACHETGANDSPVRGDMAAWEDRLAKGMDTLYMNAIEGFNEGAMPARGLCVNCSDEEVRATVDYLVAPVREESSGDAGASGASGSSGGGESSESAETESAEG